ncbi:MAG: hypothetical protein L0Y57_09110 [Beijerinckiaceae bacterium]|nr:hypothetical protein [Beijerinckiaceae bacterium]
MESHPAPDADANRRDLILGRLAASPARLFGTRNPYPDTVRGGVAAANVVFWYPAVPPAEDSEAIERVIERFPQRILAKFWRLFLEFDAAGWDVQIKAGAAAGR